MNPGLPSCSPNGATWLRMMFVLSDAVRACANAGDGADSAPSAPNASSVGDVSGSSSPYAQKL